MQASCAIRKEGEEIWGGVWWEMSEGTFGKGKIKKRKPKRTGAKDPPQRTYGNGGFKNQKGVGGYTHDLLGPPGPRVGG